VEVGYYADSKKEETEEEGGKAFQKIEPILGCVRFNTTPS